MTAEQQPAATDAELLDQAVEQVLARRRRDLTLDELEALGLALRKPCPPPRDPDRPPGPGALGKGCGARAGAECRSLADGLPLTRLLFHHARGVAAGVHVPSTDPDELAARDELTRASVDYQARQHWEQTGTDLEGYHRGEPWSPDGAHLERRKGTRR